jgi:hypothetical protein
MLLGDVSAWLSPANQDFVVLFLCEGSPSSPSFGHGRGEGSEAVYGIRHPPKIGNQDLGPTVVAEPTYNGPFGRQQTGLSGTEHFRIDNCSVDRVQGRMNMRR